MDSCLLKKEVDWSLLTAGLTLPNSLNDIFGIRKGRLIKKGESKKIFFLFCGKAYTVKVTNVNFDPKFNRKTDTLQIRYSQNGPFAQALQQHFCKSYNYLKESRDKKSYGKRAMLKLPDEHKEYLLFYSSGINDLYQLDSIKVSESGNGSEVNENTMPEEKDDSEVGDIDFEDVNEVGENYTEIDKICNYIDMIQQELGEYEKVYITKHEETFNIDNLEESKAAMRETYLMLRQIRKYQETIEKVKEEVKAF